MKEALFYDDVAPYYGKLSERRVPYLSAVNKLIVDRLRLSNPHPVSMLDIGSGDGTRALVIADSAQIKQLVFVEPSQEMINQIKRLDIPLAINSCIYQGKAEYLHEIIADQQFDVITVLWNVLGHIPDHQLRIAALQNMRHLLSENSILFFDLNNRYNVGAYGKKTVRKNYQLDVKNPQEKFGQNGDIFYEMHCDGKDIPAWGHVFTIEEAKDLIKSADLSSANIYFIDYNTGEIVPSVGQGQFLFVYQKQQPNCASK